MDQTHAKLTHRTPFSGRPWGGTWGAPALGRRLNGIIGALLCALIAGCDPSAVAPAAQETKQSNAVTIIRPERRTIRTTFQQPGTIEPFEQTPLHAKIAGFVKEIRVDIGDVVKAGDILAELSVPEMDEELKQKEALVQQASAEVDQADAALAAADAAVKTMAAQVKEAEAGRKRAEAMMDYWKGQLKRIETATTIEKQVVEESRYQLRAAEATREEVESKIQSAKAAHEESQAKRAKAAADVAAAKAKRGVAAADQKRMAALVGYSQIRAPYNGVITKRNVDTGAFLQPATGGKAEALLVIMRADKVRIFIDLPESAAPYVGKDAVARVQVEALGRQEFKASVARTAWALDPKSRTLRAEIDLPNANGPLRPGMYSYASVVAQRENVLTLPRTSLMSGGEQYSCYRIADGKAVLTFIQVGLKDHELVEVLRFNAEKSPQESWENFTGKEQIVADPRSVKDGDGVNKE
jgi:HlyD family secretion protein